MTKTDSYTLTPAAAPDLAALHDLLCVPQVYRYQAEGAPPPPLVTQAWLDKSAEDFERHQVGLWLLHKKGSEPFLADLAGCVRLDVMDTLPGEAAPGPHPAAELTYVLHPDHWGQGLATRMAWTVMAHAFNRGIDAILAGADGPNTASLAVMKRLDMQFYRTVSYPAGEGVEYLLRAGDPTPTSAPAPLSISSRT